MEPKKHIEELIELYLNGELTPAEIEELWVEIFNNPEYLEHLETNILLREFYRRKQKKSSGASRRYYQWAAAMAALFMIVFTVNILYPGDSLPATETSIDLYELESPEVMRWTANEQLTGGDSLLHNAFNAAVMGHDDEAIRIYHEITNNQDYEDYAARAYMNMGILQYNNQQYQDAARAFRSAIGKAESLPLIEEKSHWYLGNAYVNLNSLDAARESISRTFELDGEHKAQSAEMLRSLDSILNR